LTAPTAVNIDLFIDLIDYCAAEVLQGGHSVHTLLVQSVVAAEGLI